MCGVERYPSWWPWLRAFDAQGLRSGDLWQCVVKPPLPYELSFTVDLVEVSAPRRIDVRIGGDVHGTASVAIAPEGSGSEVRVRSRLSPVTPVLRGVAFVAWPVARYAHDWIIDTGARQFVEQAL